MLDRIRDCPVFICGHPKAGTSLLRALLDSHPQLVVYPEESVFFRRYLPKSTGLDVDEQLNLAERYLIHIFSWNVEDPPPSQEGFPDRDYKTISYQAVKQVMVEIVEAVGVRHPGDILSAAVLSYGKVTRQLNSDIRYWVDKSPYTEYYAERIYSWWPRAHCIHVIRDPRDNFLSYRRKHPDWKAEFFANNWERSTQAGLINEKRYGKSSYWLVEYETIVRQPEEFILKLCDYLNIDDYPGLMNPTRAGIPWIGNSMFDEEFLTISSEPVGRWKTELSRREVQLLELMLKKYLEGFGYSSSSRWHPLIYILAITWPIRRRFSRLIEIFQNSV
jgi:hypothetical protein